MRYLIRRNSLVVRRFVLSTKNPTIRIQFKYLTTKSTWEEEWRARPTNACQRTVMEFDRRHSLWKLKITSGYYQIEGTSGGNGSGRWRFSGARNLNKSILITFCAAPEEMIWILFKNGTLTILRLQIRNVWWQNIDLTRNRYKPGR